MPELPEVETIKNIIEPQIQGLFIINVTCLGKRKKRMKECLLDQSVIAGIGNIYSDEILFRAKIYPSMLRKLPRVCFILSRKTGFRQKTF